jgi:hypothetical protein
VIEYVITPIVNASMFKNTAEAENSLLSSGSIPSISQTDPLKSKDIEDSLSAVMKTHNSFSNVFLTKLSAYDDLHIRILDLVFSFSDYLHKFAFSGVGGGYQKTKKHSEKKKESNSEDDMNSVDDVKIAGKFMLHVIMECFTAEENFMIQLKDECAVLNKRLTGTMKKNKFSHNRRFSTLFSTSENNSFTRYSGDIEELKFSDEEFEFHKREHLLLRQRLTFIVDIFDRSEKDIYSPNKRVNAYISGPVIHSADKKLVGVLNSSSSSSSKPGSDSSGHHLNHVQSQSPINSTIQNIDSEYAESELSGITSDGTRRQKGANNNLSENNDHNKPHPHKHHSNISISSINIGGGLTVKDATPSSLSSSSSSTTLHSNSSLRGSSIGKRSHLGADRGNINSQNSQNRILAGNGSNGTGGTKESEKGGILLLPSVNDAGLYAFVSHYVVELVLTHFQLVDSTWGFCFCFCFSFFTFFLLILVLVLFFGFILWIYLDVCLFCFVLFCFILFCFCFYSYFWFEFYFILFLFYYVYFCFILSQRI